MNSEHLLKIEIFPLKFLRIIVDYEWNFMCWPREVIFTLGKDYEGVKAKLSIARQPFI